MIASCRVWVSLVHRSEVNSPLFNASQAVEPVKQIKQSHPGLPVLIRAYDREHHLELCDAGGDYAVSETCGSVLNMGRYGV